MVFTDRLFMSAIPVQNNNNINYNFKNYVKNIYIFLC